MITINQEQIEKISGLSFGAVLEKQNKYGYNELNSQKKNNIFKLFFEVVKEPMLALLISISIIYLFLGEQKDAFVLMFAVFGVVGITLFQKRKTEKALDALKNLSSPRALVIREGKQIRIPGREVVKEDIIVLAEGDRVPADALILSSVNLQVDESLLTGESLAVKKTQYEGQELPRRPGGDNLPYVYSGTLVVQGRATAKVEAIGSETEMGKIGKALDSIKEEDTLLQKETGRLVRYIGSIGLLLCLIIFLIYGLARGEWIQGLLSGLTLAMGILPEEFPIVLLIFLALGAWRISKRNVLTRRMPAIETLGAATVLCVDKTGTITQNRMSLNTIYVDGEYFEISEKKSLPEKFHSLMEYALLASQEDPFDPIEQEIKKVTGELLDNTEHIHKSWKLNKEYPFTKQLLSIAHVWESNEKKDYTVAAKGAPEAIADLCHFTEQEFKQLEEKINYLANHGLRLLGVAEATFEKTNLPQSQHDFKFKFVGLLGFLDPIREQVPGALKEAYSAGIRVIMITGDYPGTASFIARQIGLKDPDNFITGPQLEAMSAEDLKLKIDSVNVFSRVVPEQKLAIVNALKAHGEIVAMTGDGVNDAPALKSANIGIAMGKRGTDVAREAASLVLLDDDFTSIIEAVKRGRIIFSNLKKAISYIFAVHVPIAGLAFLPVLFGMPVILLPIHITFLELIIDPACTIVFEADQAAKDVMQRKPRNLKEPLFNKQALFFSLIQGLSVLAISFAIYLLTLQIGKGELEARTLTFSSLVIGNLIMIAVNLSWSESIINIFRTVNRTMWAVVLGTLASLVLIYSNPWLNDLFHLTRLHMNDVLLMLGVSAFIIIWFEFMKKIFKKRYKVI
ncbi:MAG: cation-translocating P-type ATPase [Patescibacteria group bacterium]|jgi:Ca2+-transporting ATPase